MTFRDFDFNKSLQEVNSLSKEVTKDLDRILANKLELKKHLGTVTELSTIAMDERLDDLCANLDMKLLLSQGVNRKVKNLKDAQDRAQNLMLQSNIYSKRKLLLAKLSDAIVMDDFTGGLTHIEAWNQLDLLSSQISDSTLKTALPIFEFDVHIKKFQKLLQDRIKVSINENKSDDFSRLIVFFPKVQLSSVGLQIFCNFYRKQIGKKFEVLSGDEKGNFVSQLSNIFQHTIELFSDNREHLLRHYGPHSVGEFLFGLQNENSLYASKILHSIVSDQGFIIFSETTTKNTTSMVDLLSFDRCLNDLMLLFQYSEEYLYRMSTLYEEIYILDDGIAPNTIKSLPFFENIKGLLKDYTRFESIYLKENVKLAIKIDTVEENFNSSSVDDIFYILHKSACRAYGTGSFNVASVVLADIKTLLTGVVYETMCEKMKSLDSSIIEIFVLTSIKCESDLRLKLIQISHPINNAMIVSQYVLKLIEELQEHARTLYKESERENIEIVLSEILPISEVFKKLSSQSIQKISELLLAEFSCFELLGSQNYEFSEERYEQSSSYDRWVVTLLQSIEFYIGIFKPYFIDANFNFLVACMAESIAIRIESILFSSLRFNQLGGLHFERELRAIISQFSCFLNHSVREKFVRLTQIGMILSSESVSEIFEYWEDNTGSLIWHLTEGEIKRTMTLRSDFKKFSMKD